MDTLIASSMHVARIIGLGLLLAVPTVMSACAAGSPDSTAENPTARNAAETRAQSNQQPTNPSESTTMRSPQTLKDELAPRVLAGLTGAKRARGDALLLELCRDWVQEAEASGIADDVLGILQADLDRDIANHGPQERLALLEAEVLDRKLRVLSRQSFSLGQEVIDRKIADEPARERGRALLAEAETIGPQIDALAQEARKPALRRQLEDVMLEALYAVERKAMSARLNRYQQEQQASGHGPESGADSNPPGGPPKIRP